MKHPIFAATPPIKTPIPITKPAIAAIGNDAASVAEVLDDEMFDDVVEGVLDGHTVEPAKFSVTILA